jgi:putative oxidoreductase
MQTNTSPTRRIATIARFLMGIPLIIFGLNGFLNFIPPPAKPLAPGAAAFAGALMNSGYMMPLIGATLLIVGLLLVSNRFVPLALVLFAPFLVNSLAFHACLEHTGLPMAAIFAVLELYLAWVHRRASRSLLTPRAVTESNPSDALWTT